MDGFDGGIGNAPLVYLIIAIINTKCKLIHIQNLLLPHLQYVANDIIYIIIQLQNV